MSNPGWSYGMAPWNRTTECMEWTEDWRPCNFPYTGLSGYNPNPDYCYDTFADAVPDKYVYDLGRLIYTAVFLPFTFLFAHRVMYMLVDLGLFSFAIPFYSVNKDFTRFSVYKLLGRLVRSLIVTVGSIIVKIWMNLISFWTSTSSATSFKTMYLQRDIRLMNICIVLTWVILLPVEMYSILYTRENCHAGCVNARVSCASGSIISILTFVAMVLASRYVFLTSRVFQKIKAEGVHGVFSSRFNEHDDEASHGGRSSNATSLGDRPSTIMAPFHIRPSTDTFRRDSDDASERTTSDFSVRNSDFEMSKDLQKISENLTKDMDEIIWKRISRLTIFIFLLYIAAIGSALSDASLCVQSQKYKFEYMSPPCSNLNVFRHDSYLILSAMFFFAVALYIPVRHRVLSLDKEPGEDAADVVIRHSEQGPSRSASTNSIVSIAF